MKIYAHNEIEDVVFDIEYLVSTSDKEMYYTAKYNEKLVVNMPFLGKENTSTLKNAQGWMRNAKYYYMQLKISYPDCLSQDNIDKIYNREYGYVEIDDTFIQCFPEYADFRGDVLRHHHIGEDGQAVAIPQAMHSTGYGEIHNVEKKIGVTTNAKAHSSKVQEALEAGYIQTGDDVWSNINESNDIEGDTPKFEYIQKLDSNDELFEVFPEWKQYKGDNAKLFELKELEYSTREERMLLDSGKASYDDYIKVKEHSEFSEYLEKKNFLSDEQIVDKYNFLSDCDSTLDKFRLYEYQRSKSGTELTDTKVYFDSEGKVVGLSCYDVPSDTALELKLRDTENYLNDADMSSKYQNYDTYNKIDSYLVRKSHNQKNFDCGTFTIICLMEYADILYDKV